MNNYSIDLNQKYQVISSMEMFCIAQKYLSISGFLKSKVRILQQSIRHTSC